MARYTGFILWLVDFFDSTFENRGVDIAKALYLGDWKAFSDKCLLSFGNLGGGNVFEGLFKLLFNLFHAFSLMKLGYNILDYFLPVFPVVYLLAQFISLYLSVILFFYFIAIFNKSLFYSL